MSLTQSALLLLSYQLKLSKLPFRPRIIYIEPTNACNLECIMCPQSRMSEHRKIEFFDMGLFGRLCTEIAKIKPKVVVFHLGGEPLLNKNLPEMIAQMEAIGVDTGLSTNGTLLDKETAERLIDAGLDLIRVDFCSDKQRFETLRKGAKWESVRDNVRTLIQTKKEKQAHKPFVILQSIRFADEDDKDPSEVDAILSSFDMLDHRNIAVYKAHSFSGEFADDVKNDSRYKTIRNPEKYYPCRHAWGGIVITCNGTVLPCCRDLLGEYVLGSIHENSIMDLWNSKKYIDLRRRQKEGSYDQLSICRNCTALWEGFKPIDLVKAHFKKFASFRKERTKYGDK